ncbi:MAG: hypothetical protein A2896_00540 [Candidatus Nealsonbacteria bacterium RIFCSPLOWO2_01_FULL_43_32]|uniref:Glutamate synthase domain-containing protein n=1 Tax=Candidatus Nealsonbacteria bacterium RIFCSPLOWO2_01_FULL_43_32 TaxID=1801672 RepID=A0A1G2EFN3_9BACT|nr:MAG: hypothetical protein A2896_00540 [Candidatus Nealsonbacteria bacterium RIFCSPLOWO2_01_FULL_43_32]
MEQDWIKEVKNRIKGVPLASGRSNKLGKISFDDLVFVPAQLAKRPVDYFREAISTKTIIGKNSKKPITLDAPILIGAMSFGALSKEAKIALAKASTLAGTIENTGEGGMILEEREFSKHLIVQYSTGRFGINEEVLKKADAIEIKIGQGAKPGQGGLLPKEKVTEEIAKIRKVEKGQDIHSPPYHVDIKNIENLREKVKWLRELTGGKPIIIKLGAGDVASDVSLAVQANPDIIALDGIEGGTGAAPEVMLDEVGIPTLAALHRARKTLDELKAPQELWIGGGFNKGGDFAKALALGADAVFVAFPLMVAMGCTYCKLCYLGKCPVGIATQDEVLRKKLDIEAAPHIASFIKNCTEEIKMVAGAVGKNNVHDLAVEDLRALTPEVAKITGTKFI